MNTPDRPPAPGLARAYMKSERMFTHAQGTARGLFDGLWLGILSRRQLARIDEAYYTRERIYRTQEYNRGGLHRWEQDVIGRHFSSARRLVVTCAGGGREVLALDRAGFHVAGFEPHDELARFGTGLLAAEGAAAAISPCVRDRWPGGDEPVDGVVVGWGGYMCIAGRAHRVAFLTEAAACLPTGGPILLSFFAREGAGRRFAVAARVANRLRRHLRREPVDLGDALVPNAVHVFSRADITAELDAGGFDLAEYDHMEYGWAVGIKRDALR